MLKRKASALAEASRAERFKLLGCFLGGRRRSGFAGIGTGDFAAEALDPASRVDQLLLAGKEWVACGADFDHHVALVGRAGIELVATGALNVDDVVPRVNTFFWHLETLSLG